MADCSLCSFLGIIYRSICNIFWIALDYPIFVLFLSVLIAFIFVSNIQMAKMICNLSAAEFRDLWFNDARNSFARPYDYGAELGPHTWQSSNSNQSPINIIKQYAQSFPIRELLTWNHYEDLPTAITMENNGHTVIVRATFADNVPTLCGADLLVSYRFVEMCFRWSFLNNEGSEHMLQYHRFPLELQAMHQAGPSTNCTSSYDILMVAYFFDISAENPYLTPFIQNLIRIRKPGSKIEIPPFPLSYLCHQFRSDFYSYGGSLTEPPCYEGAEWFIFPEALAISERQLNEFRQILSADGKNRILRNARPVQNVNDTRTINFNQYSTLNNCTLNER